MTTTPGPLTAEAILDTAEQVLRRHGPAKTSVVDVARALEVSHGTVYRHFASKAALRDAVTERWLDRVSAPLAPIVEGPGSATRRLHDWLVALSSTKQSMAADDPELFATFHQLTIAAREVVDAHVEHLARQLRDIIASGMESGELVPGDADRDGWAVLHATARFHHPAFAAEWGRHGLAEELEAVIRLLLDGLRPR